MKDLITLVSGIEYKTRKLIDRQSIISLENIELKNENKELLKQVDELKLKVKQLEYKSNIIKITKALDGRIGTTNAKLKLNELLREVDKCIGLLND